MEHYKIAQCYPKVFLYAGYMYQITLCHIQNTAILMATFVRTSDNVVVSVAKNLILPFLYYTQQEEHGKYAYQISGILCTSYYRQFDFQVKV
jgi:hypothetical protein